MLQIVYTVHCGVRMLALLSISYIYFVFVTFFFQVLLCKKYFAVNIELFYKHIFMVSFFGRCSGWILGSYQWIKLTMNFVSILIWKARCLGVIYWNAQEYCQSSEELGRSKLLPKLTAMISCFRFGSDWLRVSWCH